jgi:hypothetical protein
LLFLLQILDFLRISMLNLEHFRFNPERKNGILSGAKEEEEG